MERTQIFKNMHLSAEKMKEFDEYLTHSGGIFHEFHESHFRLVFPDNAIWDLDFPLHFLGHYQPSLRVCYERRLNDIAVIVVNFQGASPASKLMVVAPEQKIIDSIFGVMERCLAESVVKAAPSRKRFCRRPVARIRKGGGRGGRRFF